MALPGNKNFSDYDNYITDTNPTTSVQAQDYFRNQAELLKAVIDCDFWQPETVYQPGDVVKSDSMPNGTEAVMVATKASVTSNVEPQWGAVGGANISDGACFWKLRYKATVTDAMADYPLRNTAYSLNAIVACPYHAEFMLKCTQAGRTGEDVLATIDATLGKVYTDGGVKWEVINPLNDYLPLAGGVMSGIITIPQRTSSFIRGVDSACSLQINSANKYTEGACLLMWGKDSTDERAGKFELYAAGNDGRCVLVGSPDGGLTWNNQSVLREPGCIDMFAGDTIPNGWLPCNGAAVSRTTYAALFAAIGTTYGTGDGSTTFNLPNLNNLTNGVTGNLKVYSRVGEAVGTETLTRFRFYNSDGTHYDGDARAFGASGGGSGQGALVGGATTSYQAIYNSLYAKMSEVNFNSTNIKYCIKY